MDKQFLKKSSFWGFALWLFGYVFGIILFIVLPHSMIGWIIFPMGIVNKNTKHKVD